jgi:hypothetical protein
MVRFITDKLTNKQADFAEIKVWKKGSHLSLASDIGKSHLPEPAK